MESRGLRFCGLALLLLALAPANAWPQSLLPGFRQEAEFDEQVRWSRLESGVRVMLSSPARLTTARRLLVIYATPNGNTIEQTLGCAPSKELVLDGKKVVGPDGGTFRATERMLTRFRRDGELAGDDAGPFNHTAGLAGQMQFFVHQNPENKILHTALVGEMNGLLHGLTLGAGAANQWGAFGGPRAYVRWIQRQPPVDPLTPKAVIATEAPEVRLAFPARSADALTGTQFRNQIAALPREQREAAILKEITSGNVPDFLRRLIPLRIEAADAVGKSHTATFFVMCDYLAIGSNDDFFRVPMTPQTATAIADLAGCSLITKKISDDVFAAAAVKVDPKPLTKDRDTALTFFEHHQIIEGQLAGRERGSLVAGIKKDVVLTNRLREKPHRVAIYGWHYPDGRPIQPLYVGHVDWYVDYSHGIRLMANQVLVDGRSLTVTNVLTDPLLHVLLSSEGPLDATELRKAAQW